MAPGASSTPSERVVIVGAGAAGLLAALAARGAVSAKGEPSAPRSASPSVLLLDGSKRIGLKILVSGGGRCNVTNERVTEQDFCTGEPRRVRGALAGFPPDSIRRFLEARGVPLYAEPLGKLFPVTNRADDVLGALLSAVHEAGAEVRAEADVVDVVPGPARGGFRVVLQSGEALFADRVVLATGGKSLPRTGSRGFGFDLAVRLGHTVVEPLPALAPLVLGPEGPLAGIAGVTVPALLSLVPSGAPPEQIAGARFRPLARAAGSLLVTHRGASGPAALDVSAACARALREKRSVTLEGDFWTLTRPEGAWAPFLAFAKPPGACLASTDTPRLVRLDEFRAELLALAGERTLLNALSLRMPRALAEGLLRVFAGAKALDASSTPRTFGAPAWRAIHAAVVHADLRVAGVDGYEKAEATAGGVALDQLDRVTLESRLHPGLFFCGEVCDVVGRLGGFNFQWAWSSGFAAGRACGGTARVD